MVKLLDGTWWPGRIASYTDYMAWKPLSRKQVTVH